MKNIFDPEVVAELCTKPNAFMKFIIKMQLTLVAWNTLFYKNLDHRVTQFNV